MKILTRSDGLVLTETAADDRLNIFFSHRISNSFLDKKKIKNKKKNRNYFKLSSAENFTQHAWG